MSDLYLQINQSELLNYRNGEGMASRYSITFHNTNVVPRKYVWLSKDFFMPFGEIIPLCIGWIGIFQPCGYHMSTWAFYMMVL